MLVQVAAPAVPVGVRLAEHRDEAEAGKPLGVAGDPLQFAEIGGAAYPVVEMHRPQPRSASSSSMPRNADRPVPPATSSNGRSTWRR